MPDFSAIISALTSAGASTGSAATGGDAGKAGLDGAFADLLAMLTATIDQAGLAASSAQPAPTGLPTIVSPPPSTVGAAADKPTTPGLDQLMAMLDEAFALLGSGDDADPTIAHDVGAAIDAIARLMTPQSADPAAIAAGTTTGADARIAVQRLTLLTGDLANLLSPLNPDLGQRLEALSETLKSGGSLTEALARLATPQDAGSLAAPGFAQLLGGKTVAATHLPTPAGAAPPSSATALPAPPPADAPAPQSDPTASVDGPRGERPTHSAKEPTSPPAAQVKIADAAPPPDPSSSPTAPPRVEAAAATAPAPHLRPYSGSPPHIDMPQLAYEIVRQAQGGSSRFEIRLDPPELGRIDVRLDIDKGGAVHARMTVDQTETLDLLQRDQRALERAMVQAGLDPAKTSLEFSLRQNPFTPDGDSRHGRDTFPPAAAGPQSSVEPDVAVVSLYRGTASAGGLNLYV